MKDLIILIKTFGGKISKVFKFFQKEKKSEDETDEMISIIGWKRRRPRGESIALYNVRHFCIDCIILSSKGGNGP